MLSLQAGPYNGPLENVAARLCGGYEKRRRVQQLRRQLAELDLPGKLARPLLGCLFRNSRVRRLKETRTLQCDIPARIESKTVQKRTNLLGLDPGANRRHDVAVEEAGLNLAVRDQARDKTIQASSLTGRVGAALLDYLMRRR